MRPILHIQSDISDEFLKSLIANLAAIDCGQHFSNHLGQAQTRQADTVRDFQRIVLNSVSKAFPAMTWASEHQLQARRDAIDIFGHDGLANVVIEMDKSRADQVAKKFVSRSAMLPGVIYYISLCYPGTEHMSVPECKKYFDYCASLSKRLGNVYAAFIIQ